MTVLSCVQPVKASAATDRRLDDASALTVTVSSFAQPANASAPTDESDSGSTTDVRLPQSAKARAGSANVSFAK